MAWLARSPGAMVRLARFALARLLDVNAVYGVAAERITFRPRADAVHIAGSTHTAGMPLLVRRAPGTSASSVPITFPSANFPAHCHAVAYRVKGVVAVAWALFIGALVFVNAGDQRRECHCCQARA